MKVIKCIIINVHKYKIQIPISKILIENCYIFNCTLTDFFKKKCSFEWINFLREI